MLELTAGCQERLSVSCRLGDLTFWVHHSSGHFRSRGAKIAASEGSQLGHGLGPGRENWAPRPGQVRFWWTQGTSLLPDGSRHSDLPQQLLRP